MLTHQEMSDLVEAEAVIQAGLQSTWEVMTALHRINAQRLYRATHGTFEAYLDERWGFSRSQGHRLARSGAVLAELVAADLSHACDIPGRTLDVLARAPEGKRAEVYTEAVAAAQGTPSTEQIREAVEARRSAFDDPSLVGSFWMGAKGSADLGEPEADEPAPVVVDRVGNVGRLASPEETTDDWHTPPEVLDLARAILGGFDTDPASCREAQDRVRASRWYGPVEDGLVLPWPGRVWLNPPFSNIAEWVDGAVERVGGDTDAVILCCHANTDARWWHKLAAYPVALSQGRVRYLRPGGEPGPQPPKGSALFLLGGDRDTKRRFVEALKLAGWDVRAPLGWRP